ncbi:MAG: arginine--tRNA ligase [Planctomycetes bacterium]|nr:arginine--tRNA ligase [Planctomycetota bacterium]
MNSYKNILSQALSPLLGLPSEEVAAMFVTPPDSSMGDIGLPCFPLAKKLQQSPAQIASKLSTQLELPEGFSKISTTGPYLNFTIDRQKMFNRFLAGVRSTAKPFGASEIGKGQTVVMDYSHPNIAKPLAIHHVRSTIIGAALCRLYKFLGYTVEGVNHLGDWGTNFGQLMVSYKRYEAAQPDQEVNITRLLEMYIQFHKDAGNEEGLDDQAREWFVKLESGDPEAVRLWELFREESLNAFKKLYRRFGIEFEHYIGESFFNDKMEATLERIAAKGISEISEGALVVKFEDDKMPPCLLRKSDGSTLYATRDLAAAEYRYERWHFAKCLYVVANQQELHFRQVFGVLEKMGYDWAKNCEHIKFGMLAFGPDVFPTEEEDDTAFGRRTTGSTRRGHIVFLEEVLDRARDKARDLVVDNAREDEVLQHADELAEMIGVGAIVFNELAQRRVKDVLFTWDKALNLHGDSGPYLQYTHARLSSVLRKYGKELPEEIDYSTLGTEAEAEVAKAVAAFPEIIERAVRENEPSVVSDYLLALCSEFNRFFTDKVTHRIISDEEALTLARVGLVDCVRTVLATGLGLLGIQAPERM